MPFLLTHLPILPILLPMLAGTLLLAVLVFNLLADIVYKFIDPRVQLK